VRSTFLCVLRLRSFNWLGVIETVARDGGNDVGLKV